MATWAAKVERDVNIFEQDGHFDAQTSSSWFTMAVEVADSIAISFTGFVFLIVFSFMGSRSSMGFVTVSNVLLLLSLIGGVLGVSLFDDSFVFCSTEDVDCKKINKIYIYITFFYIKLV